MFLLPALDTTSCLPLFNSLTRLAYLSRLTVNSSAEGDKETEEYEGQAGQAAGVSQGLAIGGASLNHRGP
jgi:hypothetical protein